MTALILGILAVLPIGLIPLLPFLLPILPVAAAEFLKSPIGRDIFAAVVVIIAVVLAWTVFGTHYYNKGYARAISDIAAQDEKAVNAAKAARAAVDACYAAGRRWEDGQCVDN